jgi:Fe-S oxidoreductase
MNAAIGKGDFQAAARVFRRNVPFASIISRICDHPCEPVCKRREVGEAIAIRGLERAALAYAQPEAVRMPPLPKKDQSVAVIGAGLSGLTAAFDLARKGYRVTVFEAGHRPGGRVLTYPESVLPPSLILEDLEILAKLPIVLRLSTEVGVQVSLEKVQQEHHAVYVAIGRDLRQTFGIEPITETADGAPATFATSLPGVFAGGCGVYGPQSYSPITSLSHGRRAAISIDRFLQKVSLTASRENEGPYETRLFTSIEGIKPVPRTPVSDPMQGYSPEEAQAEGGRCLQCECMECVKICEYLAEYKGYPKKYVRQIYNNLSIVMGQRHGNKLINSCSLCGLCKEVCPESLNMGDICQAARFTMVSQGKMPPSAHEFALKDMEFSNSDKSVLVRHEPGTSASSYIFFPGCQLTGSAPDHVKKTYRYLRERLQGGVGLMLRCCGAPAAWAGRAEIFSGVMGAFRAEWVEMGSPELILACSSCYKVFKEHLPEARLTSLWEAFESLGLPQADAAADLPVLAIHDPCTSRHEDAMQQSVRNLVTTMGLQVAELPLSRDKTECCGFGGLMYFANRQLADKVVDRRIHETPMDLLGYCAVCCDHFRAEGKPTWHLLDLIFGGKGIGSAPPAQAPDYSQRRENRVRLKHALLAELWREDDVEQDDYQGIVLHIPEDVRKMMEQRMILVEDVQQVIQWAEKTGTKLANRTTGHWLAHYRPGTVTYWVEYSVADDGFTLHNAYSHRMEVLEEMKP